MNIFVKFETKGDILSYRKASSPFFSIQPEEQSCQLETQKSIVGFPEPGNCVVAEKETSHSVIVHIRLDFGEAAL